MENNSQTCPSSRFSKGSLLFGIKNDQGQMDILEDPIKITEEIYVQLESVYSKPEKALRVANKCLESGCKQWTGVRCGVIDNLVQNVEESFVKEDLPNCAIRPTCRWHQQSGDRACKICPLVTTYLEDPIEDKFFNRSF